MMMIIHTMLPFSTGLNPNGTLLEDHHNHLHIPLSIPEDLIRILVSLYSLAPVKSNNAGGHITLPFRQPIITQDGWRHPGLNSSSWVKNYVGTTPSFPFQWPIMIWISSSADSVVSCSTRDVLRCYWVSRVMQASHTEWPSPMMDAASRPSPGDGADQRKNRRI